jgi:glycosyltransferase involved in cell wall biosynthesis
MPFMQPLVSVIIPTYNRAAFLKEALDSLEKQIFKDFEVIVIDDGSTDTTQDILKAYQSKINLRAIAFSENQGVSKARNWGIRESHLPWIAFLDSDDQWTPNKLEVQMKYLKEHPDIKICQTEEIWIRDGVRVNPMKKHEKSGGDIFRRALELCIVSPSATVVSRRLLDEVGPFDESLPVCEDYDLWLRISYRYPIGLIDEPLIIKRGGHADQLSKKYPAMDYYRIQSIKNLLMSHPLTKDQGAQAIEELRKKCAIFAGGAKKRGKLKEAGEIENLAKRYS